MIETLFWLILLHAIGDFALQNDYVATNKKRSVSNDWIWINLMHAAIHAGLILWITNNWLWMIVELCMHFYIDFLKCEDVFGFRTDQALHMICKVVYVVLLV